MNMLPLALIRTILCLISLVSIIILLPSLLGSPECVWWSRKTHLLFAMGLLGSSLYRPEYMPPIVLADVLFGIGSSLWIQPF